MNTYETQRRQEIVAVLADESVPRRERFERVASLVEREIRSAYVRGLRDAARPRRKSYRDSALKAGKLQPVDEEVA